YGAAKRLPPVRPFLKRPRQGRRMRTQGQATGNKARGRGRCREYLIHNSLGGSWRGGGSHSLTSAQKRKTEKHKSDSPDRRAHVYISRTGEARPSGRNEAPWSLALLLLSHDRGLALLAVGIDDIQIALFLGVLNIFANDKPASVLSVRQGLS